MMRVHAVVAEPTVSLEQPAGAPGSPTPSQLPGHQLTSADHGNVLHAAVLMMCVCVCVCFNLDLAFPHVGAPGGLPRFVKMLITH
jgi:hypothetical protein